MSVSETLGPFLLRRKAVKRATSSGESLSGTGWCANVGRGMFDAIGGPSSPESGESGTWDICCVLTFFSSKQNEMPPERETNKQEYIKPTFPEPPPSGDAKSRRPKPSFQNPNHHPLVGPCPNTRPHLSPRDPPPLVGSPSPRGTFPSWELIVKVKDPHSFPSWDTPLPLVGPCPNTRRYLSPRDPPHPSWVPRPLVGPFRPSPRGLPVSDRTNAR